MRVAPVSTTGETLLLKNLPVVLSIYVILWLSELPPTVSDTIRDFADWDFTTIGVFLIGKQPWFRLPVRPIL